MDKPDEEAIPPLRRASAIWQVAGNETYQGMVLTNLGEANLHLGRLEQALSAYQKAFEVA